MDPHHQWTGGAAVATVGRTMGGDGDLNDLQEAAVVDADGVAAGPPGEAGNGGGGGDAAEAEGGSSAPESYALRDANLTFFEDMQGFLESITPNSMAIDNVRHGRRLQLVHGTTRRVCCPMRPAKHVGRCTDPDPAPPPSRLRCTHRTGSLCAGL